MKGSRRRPPDLVETSFLRRVDPRTKLALSLSASIAVMLPLPELAVFFAAYSTLVFVSGVAPHALAGLRRISVLLGVLFAADALFIGVGFAVLITLRLSLLVGAFSLVLATTRADELSTALEQIRVPHRLAFTFATAYCSLGSLEVEWHGIVEAQRARGIVEPAAARLPWRDWRERLRQSLSLVVPAVVLVAQRAWSISEAAAVRGFDSPLRRPHRRRQLATVDHLLLAGAVMLPLALLLWR